MMIICLFFFMLRCHIRLRRHPRDMMIICLFFLKALKGVSSPSVSRQFCGVPIYWQFTRSSCPIVMTVKKNKAGYTANTSCGRVGSGGNARFHTFRLVVTDRRTDGQTDKGSYRVACPQLKTMKALLTCRKRFFWQPNQRRMR